MISGLPGGDKRDRTADLLNAIQALSQLSYTPICLSVSDSFCIIAQLREKSRGNLKKYENNFFCHGFGNIVKKLFHFGGIPV